MWQFLKGLFTEDDAGTTACPIRVFGGGGVLTFLGAEIFTVIHSMTFDMQAFGVGFGALLASIAGGISAKAHFGADAGNKATGNPT